MKNRFKFLFKIDRIFWLLAIAAIPVIFIQFPYFNLLLFGFDEKITYAWVAILLIFRPKLKLIYLLVVGLLLLSLLTAIFYKSGQSNLFGLIMYVSLIYLFFKSFKSVFSK